MKRLVALLMSLLLIFSLGVSVQSAHAQDAVPLKLTTTYPGVVVGLNEGVSFDLKVSVSDAPHIVKLEVTQLPEGWTATLRGGGKTIQSVYVEPGKDVSVDLRLDQPKEVQSGTFNVLVTASADGLKAQLPLQVTVKEKQPARLTLSTDLPTIKGGPTSTFSYDVTLKNEGDEDMTVSLSASAPAGFQVTFRLGAQDVTSFPINARETKRLTVRAEPYVELAAGTYPLKVTVQSGEVQTSLDLNAEVTGQPTLSLTAPDGRLSAQVRSGRETPLKLVVRNTGTAPARGIKLSSNEPSGWKVTFEPESIEEVAAGEEVTVTVKVKPADNALAGDYMLTLRAAPTGGSTKSADFRITVLTSTLWGLVGIVLIAVAVGVVLMAVMRFGRR